MRKLFGKAIAVTLFGSLAITACGSDDETSPTASGIEATDAPEITPEIVQLTGILLQSFQDIFFAVLVLPEGAGTIPGAGGGSVEVAGTQWVIKDYSPDGALKLNGTLTVAVNPNADPPSGPATGAVEVIGITTTTMELNLELQLVSGSLTSDGTITINGIAYDARTLFDAVSAAQAAAAG